MNYPIDNVLRDIPKAELERLAPPASATQVAPDERTGARIMTAREIMAMILPPLQWIIPEILPAGLAILAAPPKAGKSYFALDTAMAVAGVGVALGKIEVGTGDVLYLSFEEGVRIIQSRMRQLRPYDREKAPERLNVLFSGPRVGDGLLELVEDWIAKVCNPRLIVIDTWRTVKPESGRHQSVYDEDANAMAPFHELTKRHPTLCVLIVHHTRKMEATDSFANVSGSYGLTGVVNTMLVLQPHGDNGHKLCIRGREVEDAKKELKRDRLTGGWIVCGDARALAKSRERQEILGLLHEAAAEEKSLTPSQIASELGKSRSAVSTLLKRMVSARIVRKAGYGKYEPVDHIPLSVDSVDFIDSHKGNGGQQEATKSTETTPVGSGP